MEAFIPMLDMDGIDHIALAAAAVTEAIGGEDVVNMLLMRHQGRTLKEIGERYGKPLTTIASRLEVAEARVDRVRQLARRINDKLPQESKA